MDDIVIELRDIANYGYMPAKSREAVKKAIATIEVQDAEITRLRAALDARDAEIAAWLRGEEAYDLASCSEHHDLLTLADAIEAGQYRKENGDG